MERLSQSYEQLTKNKYLGLVVILEAENKLLELRISELEEIITDHEKMIADSDSQKQKLNLELNIAETSLRICEIQTKIKLNNISITRIKTRV